MRGYTAKVGLRKPCRAQELVCGISITHDAHGISYAVPAHMASPRVLDALNHSIKPDLLAELDDPHDHCGPESPSVDFVQRLRKIADGAS